MKEKDVAPGTIYPLLGKLLCFLPEHLKTKLCCVTPLGQTVSKMMKFNYRMSNTFESHSDIMIPAQYCLIIM